jgi:DNA-binding XRE family transcriptional regulator
MYNSWSDLYRTRTNRGSLPFCHFTLKAKKPSKIIKNPNTIGEHLRKRRQELNMFQFEVAKIIGVTEDTICNWENNRSYPKGVFFPRIIYFLGYNPMKNTKKLFLTKSLSTR